MWKRLGERVGLVLLTVPMIAWYLVAIGIAVWLLRLAGIAHGRRLAFELAFVVFLFPIGVVVAFNEFVWRRLRYGSAPPSRHKRTTLTSDELAVIDQHPEPTGESEPGT